MADADVTESLPLRTPPGVLRGRPLDLGVGRSGCAWWNSWVKDGSKMSLAATHDLSSGP